MTTSAEPKDDMTTIDLTKDSPAGGDGQPERQPASVATRAPAGPLLPMWLRDRETLVGAVRATWRQAWRSLAGFVIGLLTLAPRLLLAWPWRGFGRLVRGLAKWIHDQDTADRRAAAPDNSEYDKISRWRKANLHARLLVAASIVVPVLVPVLVWLAPVVLAWLVGIAAGAWIIKLIPGRSLVEVIVGVGVAAFIGVNGPGWLALVPAPPVWVAWWLAALAWLALGWCGRPLDGAVISSALAASGPPALRPMLIVEALCSLGNAKMTAKTEETPRTAIRLLTDIHRHGPGVQVDLELPPGVPATWVMEKREELAAALRRELGCVWPSVGGRHPAHLVLYVADEPMSKARQARWPLADAPRIDIFEPQPIATDQRGRWVNLSLAYSNGVIGAVPRMGKTFSLRELALVAGMDPRVRVYGFDGKGTGDLSPLAPFAHYIGVGDEDEDILEQLSVMRSLREEMRRRARVIRELPREECPESKVTSDLAGRRDLGLEPVMVSVDESQVWFLYGEKSDKRHKQIREEFASICTDLVKRGPALGIWLFLASQQVNADTIPTSISSNAVIRLCLKIFGQVANDQILGTGARKEGVDATMFATSDKGIAYLRADGSDAQIVRMVHGLDAVEAEKLAQKIRAMRQAAGRLTGQAADEDDEQPQILDVDLLDDVREVMTAEQHRNMALAEILDALRLLRPQLYGAWDVATLGSALRDSGVRVGTVRVEDETAKGVRWEWVVTEPDDAA
jgi:S-DNA-T family DNA segregation ATPase FtsK/SpoIIIE